MEAFVVESFLNSWMEEYVLIVQMRDFIQFPVSLQDAWLAMLSFNYPERKTVREKASVEVEFHASHTRIDETQFIVRLHAKINCPEIGYMVEAAYDGLVVSEQPITDDRVESFTEIQCMRHLLPYVREVIASTTVRANLPPYVIPTIDILQTMMKRKNEGGQIEDAAGSDSRVY